MVYDVIDAELFEDKGRRGQTRQFYRLTTTRCDCKPVVSATWTKDASYRRNRIDRDHQEAVAAGRIPARRKGKITTPIIHQRPEDCGPPPKTFSRGWTCNCGKVP